VPLLRPTPRQSTPIATTAPRFVVSLDAEGGMKMQLIA
jgi:hypothetical protein